MTRTELESKYQLVEQVTHGDIRTHHAVAGGGTVVMVHFVRPDSPKGRAALEAVEVLVGDEAEKILRTHEVEGETVLVTRFLMDEGSLEGWLGLDEGQPDPPEEDDEPGEFTKLFKAQQAPVDPTPPAAPPADDPPSPPEPAAERPPEPPATEAPPPADEPADEDESRQSEQGQAGEFTRLFKAIRPGPGEEPESPDPNAGETPPAESGSPSPPKPSPPPPRSPSAPPPAARRPDKPTEAPEDSTPQKAKGGGPSGSGGPSRPGSFTQEFGRVPRPGEGAEPSIGSGSGGRAADPPSPPAGPSKSSGAGSGGLSYGHRPDHESGPADPARGARASGGDDYLDRLRSAGGPPPPSPPPPGAGKSGTGPGRSGSGAGSAPGTGPGDAGPSPKPPPSGKGGQKGSTGPSEFTRVVSAMSSSQRPSTPRPPSAPRPSTPSAPRRPPSGLGSGKGPSTVLLVVGMAVIFVLALAVILVLAFVMNGDEAEGEPAAEGETVEEETSGTTPAPDVQSLVYFLPEYSAGGEPSENV